MNQSRLLRFGQRGRLGALATVVACSLFGCGGDTLHRGGVEGTVTWNGKPIEKGKITFVSTANRKTEATIVDIQDGRYSLVSTNGPVIGLNKIEILATRETGKKIELVFPAKGTAQKVEQYIPSKYNASSTLEREVKAGENRFDFDLSSR